MNYGRTKIFTAMLITAMVFGSFTLANAQNYTIEQSIDNTVYSNYINKMPLLVKNGFYAVHGNQTMMDMLGLEGQFVRQYNFNYSGAHNGVVPSSIDDVDVAMNGYISNRGGSDIQFILLAYQENGEVEDMIVANGVIAPGEMASVDELINVDGMANLQAASFSALCGNPVQIKMLCISEEGLKVMVSRIMVEIAIH